LLPTFRWKSLVTTNYDLLIEDAYKAHNNPIQRIVPFIRDQDRVSERLSQSDALGLIKLHGCITAVSDTSIPLILSTEQYVNYRTNRNRLFSQFKDQACERTVIFCGYSLADLNVRSILLEIDNEIASRPRYYLVLKDADEYAEGYWGSKRVTVVSGTFGQFMKSLNERISPILRGVIIPPGDGNPEIMKRIAVSGGKINRNTTSFIETNVDVVNSITSTPKIDPKQFYKGVGLGWSPIEQNLDVRRKLEDQILADYCIGMPETKLSFVVIRAHAGAGKSVLLKRLAWETAKTCDKLTLFLKPGGMIDAAAIADLSALVREPIYLFIDNLLTTRRSEIVNLLSDKSAIPGKLVVISTVSTAEWNTAAAAITSLVTDLLDLEYWM
jgi:hypothetical protein